MIRNRHGALLWLVDHHVPSVMAVHLLIFGLVTALPRFVDPPTLFDASAQHVLALQIAGAAGGSLIGASVVPSCPLEGWSPRSSLRLSLGAPLFCLVHAAILLALAAHLLTLPILPVLATLVGFAGLAVGAVGGLGTSFGPLIPLTALGANLFLGMSPTGTNYHWAWVLNSSGSAPVILPLLALLVGLVVALRGTAMRFVDPLA